MSGLLKPTEVLPVGHRLQSNNKRFKFIMQTDGNLVLYKRHIAPEGVLWASNTCGIDAKGAFLQPDGNFVIYDASGTARWSSGTCGHPVACLAVQDDGNVVIYRSDGNAIWATNTMQTVTTWFAMQCVKCGRHYAETGWREACGMGNTRESAISELRERQQAVCCDYDGEIHSYGALKVETDERPEP